MACKKALVKIGLPEPPGTGVFGWIGADFFLPAPKISKMGYNGNLTKTKLKKKIIPVTPTPCLTPRTFLPVSVKFLVAVTSAYLHKAIGSAQLILWNDEGGYGPEGGGEEAVGEAQRRDSNIGGQPYQRLEPLLNVQDIFSVYHLLRQ